MLTRRQTLQGLIALPLAMHLRQAAAAQTLPAALGYLPWWMATGWKAMPLARLDRLALFDVPIGQDGSVMGREWSTRAPHADLLLDVTLTLFGHAHFDAVFADPVRRERLLAETLRLLQQGFVSGVHLDIEGYAEARPAALAGFRQWLDHVDMHRRKLGKGLSAFFPASDRFSPYGREAAQRIDYWVAQLYDAHWPESKVTGALVTRSSENPVAVPRALARLSALGVPSQAILLSVPLYGWEWPSESEHPGAATRGPARLLTFTETPQELMPNDRLAATALASQHGLRRDGEETPYYAYRDGMQWKQGWFEDLRSLTRKLAPERAQGYAGLAFFPLGYDNGAIVEPLLRWWAAPR
jgi:spore germination protein YaaH